ncbi:MAG: hypothetical protein J0H29_09415 [Sphingobacteriales bacterium]|uniref:hypothetical protein n=1 Tax=uncultured Dysgonomonas sp. TaxID=206096 RepID=UPI0009640E68|nr:hypothetical protein [uncultured Dysgonomonas sp.]MBN8858596.1 hypothetical protein [Sphingobacteriales bacterium]OJY90041.1 MAG: hypothetical protein BGP14_10040 [Sphingobacteriales bacterium 44-15]
MDIEKIVAEIIPPSDYQHRNGFNNVPLIDKLSDDEKRGVQDALIYKLLFESEKEIDTLVIETLAYLKSQKSLPVLYKLLEKCSNGMIKLVISASIFEINKDSNMIDIAIGIIKTIDDKSDAYYVYKLTSAFYYLAKFHERKTTKLLEEYSKHPEYLISYNAKQALEKLSMFLE